MSDDTLLAQEFESHRPQLRAVAYRMLGSQSEADDAVQETWLRLSRSDSDSVENMGGWLTTVVGRICLDMLRERRARGEVPEEGPYDPIVTIETEENPAEEAELADSVGLAMLVVLETLTPAERIAFVLHDMFGVPFSEIGEIAGRSPDAARQLASRARRRVRGATPEGDHDLAEQRRVIDAFLAAARAGDFEALLEVLDPEVTFRVHAAPGDPRAAISGVGAENVAEQIITQGRPFAQIARPAIVNGAPGLVTERDGKKIGATACTVSGGRITSMDLVLDPDRLSRSTD
ncbi:MAG: sigma-70 family RNA polymerase sigma factor [Solirubrobacterales bacterium]